MENIPIGIMQGRLSSKIGQPLQSFPFDDWSLEFMRAKTIGFDQIEWLVDGTNDHNNPITSAIGRSKILKLSEKHNITINSLCIHSLINGDLLLKGDKYIKAIKSFSSILTWAQELNIKFVILPVMDSMSIQSKSSQAKLKDILNSIDNTEGPKVLLESDLPGVYLKQFIEDVALDNVGILYDLGNATALGFDIKKELDLLHSLIGEVHIKDRFSKNGSSVRLGMAETPFELAFNTLKKLLWNGSFVLETPIFDNWEDEANANFLFTKKLVKTL